LCVKTDDYDPTTEVYSTLMSSLVPPETDHRRWIVDKIDDLMMKFKIEYNECEALIKAKTDRNDDQ
ncbi:9084_t:CDS:2, partial [Gigaspora rosea]